MMGQSPIRVAETVNVATPAKVAKSMQAAKRDSLDLVTVVFTAELALLVLQARSIARYMDAGSLASIVVIINDPDEAACRAAVEALRPEYGQFADRLQIVDAASLPNLSRRPLARMEAAFVAHWRGRIRRFFGRRRTKNTAGWRDNNGWSMQQAFKLLSVQVCRGSHVVFLDAKNHFLSPVDTGTFVASDGRARSRTLQADARQLRWVRGSFAKLGLPVPSEQPFEVPPSVTPVAMERRVLASAVGVLEEALGPLECYFALHRGTATEFMLLFAVIDRGEGRWWQTHAEGLPTSLTAFGSADRQAILAAIDAARQDGVPLMGIHRRLLDRLDADVRAALLALWRERRLVADAHDFEQLFPAGQRAATTAET